MHRTVSWGGHCVSCETSWRTSNIPLVALGQPELPSVFVTGHCEAVLAASIRITLRFHTETLLLQFALWQRVLGDRL